MSTPTAIDLLISEAAFQRTVIDLLEATGWRTYHTFDSRRSASGFPDIVAVHPARGQVLYLELKTERGKVSSTQTAWLADLGIAGQQVYVWRPSDWSEIVRIVTGTTTSDRMLATAGFES